MAGSIMDTHLCIHVVESSVMTSKDVGVRIRVDRELREAFQGACAVENRNASDVLREFMQAFADRHQGGLQAALFTPASTPKQNRTTSKKSR